MQKARQEPMALTEQQDPKAQQELLVQPDLKGFQDFRDYPVFPELTVQQVRQDSQDPRVLLALPGPRVYKVLQDRPGRKARLERMAQPG